MKVYSSPTVSVYLFEAPLLLDASGESFTGEDDDIFAPNPLSLDF